MHHSHVQPRIQYDACMFVSCMIMYHVVVTGMGVGNGARGCTDRAKPVADMVRAVSILIVVVVAVATTFSRFVLCCSS